VQVVRNVEVTKVQCEDTDRGLHKTIVEAIQNTTDVSVNRTVEDVNETTKEGVDGARQHLMSFQDKLRKTLKGLSQRLTGLFISTEEEALTSNKPVTKQIEPDAIHTKTQTSEPGTKQVELVEPDAIHTKTQTSEPGTKQVELVEPDATHTKSLTSESTTNKPAMKDTQHSDVEKQVTSDPTHTVGNSARDRQQLIDALSLLPEGKQLAQSVWHVVNDIGTLDVYAVESAVSHVDLGYAGTADLVAKYK